MIQRFMKWGGALALLVVLTAGPAIAQDVTSAGLLAEAAQAVNAYETRQRLTDLLRQYPPTVWRVFQIDPALLGNKDYLTPYPALIAFLDKHPEVLHNPGFFLGNTGPVLFERDDNRIARDIAQFTAVFLVVLTIIGAITWIIKSLIDYRRWFRVSKTQSDIHTKLMDRFTASEDLLAYVQSPAGRRFLESAPIAMDPSAAAGAPISRILWSVQVGLVLGLGGAGMNYASYHLANDAAQPFFVLGVLAIALGIGFVLSALVSYLISKNLGLFKGTAETPPT